MTETNILSLFSEKELKKFKQNVDGNFTGPCPSCGRRDNYSGFVIFVDSNTCYCNGSKTTFNFAETLCLLKGIITCAEGRQKK